MATEKMMSQEEARRISMEYSQKAKEFMDRVTSPQPQEVKERVQAVRKTFDKAIDKTEKAVLDK